MNPSIDNGAISRRTSRTASVHTFKWRRVRRSLLLAVLALVPIGGLGISSTLQADAEIWVCTDPETGAKTYTGRPRNTRNCRNTDMTMGQPRRAQPGMSSPPAPPPLPGTNATAPARVAANRPPASAEMRSRDQDRKQILQDELSSENRKLAEMQREFQGTAVIRRPEETDNAKYVERARRLTEEVERSKANVRALERELARM